MNKILKRFIKFFIKILTSQKKIRYKLRSIISSSKFLDVEFRCKLRGILESVAPEEILEAKSDFLNCKFYYPNKSIIGLGASEFGFWNNLSVLSEMFFAEAETIVEVGANIGVDTILIARKVRSNCKIIAFEPCEKYRTILEKNINENSLKNVLIYNFFLSSNTTSRAKLYINPSSASAIADDSPKAFPVIDKQTCDTTTLDDFSKKICHLHSLDFLKIDTDGWDQHVIHGGINTIAKFKPFLLVEFADYLLQKTGHSNASFVKLLYELKYNNFLLFRERIGGEEGFIRIKGHKKLLSFLTPTSPTSHFNVFAIPDSKMDNL